MLLVAWRVQQALAPVVGEHTAQSVLIAFGLASLAVAVPFLWRSLPWKRLLAYSSLEHMGVIALGIGFGTPLALAGVAVHIAGHAVAKALGFYAATPLLGHEPARRRARRHAASRRTKPALGASMGDLARRARRPAALAALRQRGADRRRRLPGRRPGRPRATALLLALGFLGLAHALIETTAGDSRSARRGPVAGLRGVTALTGVSVVLLLGARRGGGRCCPARSSSTRSLRGLS